ncbi:MAG: radical SAM family heme chaperone HemW [Candidatus Borkfalkiaceae bacterium]|nr:radical SAM family heme chaperone HemW [Clostridia bacterium]MDY6223269.1 radical SAM family heme chaperone HemW [Christensenellaceae bacterium]
MAGIYIHIPFCRQKCSYCDFVSFPDKIGYAEAYMACVYKELKMRGAELKDRVFDTVYFGGGTPSYIPPKLILGAMNRIRECFRLTENPEITLELNPGTIGEEKVKIYEKAGINRFSIGLQTAIDEQLEDLGRIHNVRDYVYATKLLKGKNFSTDVMLGLKNQKKEDVKKTIELAAACGSSHISMYALTVEDGTPIYTDYLNGELPDSDEVAELYDYGRNLLASLGFNRYEISNFSKKGFESRHNLNYWRRGEYIGVGLAASSFLAGRRFTNTFNLDDYMKCVISGFFPAVDAEEVSEADAKFEKVMLALRTAEGLSLQEYEREFSSTIEEDFPAALSKMRKYLERTDGNLRIKDEYLYVQNQILMPFMEEPGKRG